MRFSDAERANEEQRTEVLQKELVGKIRLLYHIPRLESESPGQVKFDFFMSKGSGAGKEYGTIQRDLHSRESSFREFHAQSFLTVVDGDIEKESKDEERESLLSSSIEKHTIEPKISTIRQSSKFCDNKVTTSKYTLITFIPR